MTKLGQGIQVGAQYLTVFSIAKYQLFFSLSLPVPTNPIKYSTTNDTNGTVNTVFHGNCTICIERRNRINDGHYLKIKIKND